MMGVRNNVPRRFSIRACTKIFLLLTLTLTACHIRVPRDPNILVVWIGSDPNTLNPVIATEASTNQVNEFVVEQMFARENTSFDLKPQLALRYEVSPDHLHYTMWLRQGVRWHDGQPFTARDVEFTFQKINDPAVGAASLSSYFVKAGIVHCAALDDYTVRFDMEHPYAFALEKIAFMPIVPKHIYDVPTPFRENLANRHPIGTGPMRFAEWRTNEIIRVEANPDYWGNAEGRGMQIRGVDYRITSDQWVAFQRTKKGQFDFAPVRTIQWVKQTESKSFLARYRKLLIDSYSGGYTYIGWNLHHPCFTDARVRRALSMLIQRDRLIEKLLFGVGKSVIGPFYDGGPQHDPSITPIPYNPTEALRLLEDAGWIDHDGDGIRDRNGEPFHFSLMHYGGKFNDSMSNILREDFRKIGIHMDIRQLEPAVFMKTIGDHQFDAYVSGWTGDYEDDPYQIWHSSQIDKGSNYVQFANAEADRLMDDARLEFDHEKRNALYHRFEKIIVDAQPYTFLFALPERMVLHHRFTNVNIYPGGVDTREWGIGESEALYQ